MRRSIVVLALAGMAATIPSAVGAQSLFSLAVRSGYTGLTGADFDAVGGALILDLGLRYGRRHGFAIAGGGHFSNHTEAETANLDIIGAYGEGRYTFPTVSDNVLPFATVRGGYVRYTLTAGSGAGTQDAVQSGYALGGTLGVDYELSGRVDVEVAGLYSALALDDVKVNGNVTPGTERHGGQWAVLVGVVFKTGGP